jgi:hypothetical protein
LGGGRKDTGTIILEGEEIRCYTSQTFREIAEERGLEIMSEFLYSEEKGIPLFIDDPIGNMLKAGETVNLIWEISQDDDFEEDQTEDIELHYCIFGKWEKTFVRSDITLTEFMDQNHNGVELTEFKYQGETLNQNATLLCLCDEDHVLEMEVMTLESQTEDSALELQEEGDQEESFMLDPEEESQEDYQEEQKEVQISESPKDTDIGSEEEDEGISSHCTNVRNGRGGADEAERRDRGPDLRGGRGGRDRSPVRSEIPEEPSNPDGERKPVQDPNWTMSRCGRREISIIPEVLSIREDQEIESTGVTPTDREMDESLGGRRNTPKCGSDLLDKVPEGLSELPRRRNPDGSGRLDDPAKNVEELKEEINKVWNLLTGNCAIISFAGQSRQIFFNPSNAIQRLTKKIKEIWNIPRKLYWLSVNGKHESKAKSWPQVSNVEIKIRGLGAGPTQDIDLKEVRICLEGQTTTEYIDGCFLDALISRKASSIEEVWVSNRQHASVYKSFKKFVDAGSNLTFIFDEMLQSDPEALKRGALGKVKLKLEDEIIETWNNMLFKNAFQEEKGHPNPYFLRIPILGISVDTRLIKIRSVIPACSSLPWVVRWDRKMQKRINKGIVPECPDGIYITENRGLDVLEPQVGRCYVYGTSEN